MFPVALFIYLLYLLRELAVYRGLSNLWKLFEDFVKLSLKDSTFTAEKTGQFWNISNRLEKPLGRKITNTIKESPETMMYVEQDWV